MVRTILVRVFFAAVLFGIIYVALQMREHSRIMQEKMDKTIQEMHRTR